MKCENLRLTNILGKIPQDPYFSKGLNNCKCETFWTVPCKTISTIKLSVHKTSHKTNEPGVHTNIALSTKQTQHL